MGKKALLAILFVQMLLCFTVPARADDRNKNDPSIFGHFIDTRYNSPMIQEDISDFTQQELCYARNEIYARYGRRFKSSELTEYFSLMPWYTGSIRPDEFDENILSETDRQNAKLISQYEELKYGGAYHTDQPGYDIFKVRTLGGGECHSVREVMLRGQVLQLPDSFYMDLDGDGEEEYIQYAVEGDFGTLMIGRDSFSTYVEFPDDKPYGISNNGKSIYLIVYDFGPSDDPVLHMISYQNGECREIGVLPDFPTDISADPELGIIYGRIRTSILGILTYECNWKINSAGKLEMSQQDYYDLVTSRGGNPSVTLEKTLSLYKDRSGTGPAFSVSPQAAKLLYTDGEGWIYLVAQDGTEGWYPVPSHDETIAAFSGLSFAD